VTCREIIGSLYLSLWICDPLLFKTKICVSSIPKEKRMRSIPGNIFRRGNDNVAQSRKNEFIKKKPRLHFLTTVKLRWSFGASDFPR